MAHLAARPGHLVVIATSHPCAPQTHPVPPLPPAKAIAARGGQGLRGLVAGGRRSP